MPDDTISPMIAEKIRNFTWKPFHPHRVLGQKPEPLGSRVARLERMRAGSKLSDPGYIAAITEAIVSTALDAAGREVPEYIRTALADLAIGLIVHNLFLSPIVIEDRSRSSAEAAHIMDRLGEIETRLQHEERIREYFLDGVVRILIGLITEFIPEHLADSPFSLPLYMHAAPANIVGRTLATFLGDLWPDHDDIGALAFSETRKSLIENMLAVSRMTFDDFRRSPHRAVAPNDCKLDPDEIAAAYLADTPLLEFVQTPIPFAIPNRAFRAHGCVFGPSDHGKTQTLQAIIVSLLQQDDPPALFIMDSMGAMLKKLQDLALFEERLHGRLVVLDPAGPHPPALNFFKLSGGTPAQQMELLFYLFKALDQTLTARQRTTIHFLAQLMQKIDGALDDLRKVCEEKPPQHLDAIKDLPPVARDFFLNAFYKPDALMTQTKQQIAARLYTLASTPIFDMFSARDNTFNAYECIQQKKIVLVNTDRLALGDEGSTIFGRFVLAQCLAAAFARAPIPEDQRHLALLVVDEAKAYFDEQTEKFLADARQFGLGLFFATQYVAQLAEGVRRAVYGNTAIKFIGPIEYGDRVSLAREMNTTPEFIGGMRSIDHSHTEWAVHVRTSNMTPQAIKLRVPFGILEKLPKATRPYRPPAVAQSAVQAPPPPPPPKQPQPKPAAARPVARDQPEPTPPPPPDFTIKPGKEW